MGYPDLRRLTVCRNLLEDAVINKLVAIRLKEQEEPVGEPDRRKAEIQILRSELTALLVKKAETLGLSGNILSSYMVHCLAEGSNTAADIIEAMTDETAAKCIYVGMSAGIAGPLLTTPGADFNDDRELALRAGYAVGRKAFPS